MILGRYIGVEQKDERKYEKLINHNQGLVKGEKFCFRNLDFYFYF